MANFYADNFAVKPTRTGTAGGGWSEQFSFQKAGVALGDKIYLGVLTAGVVYDENKFIFDDCGSLVTANVGYEPYNNTEVPANLTYWHTGVDVATAAGATDTKAHPIEFANSVALVITVGGAAFTGSPKLTVAVRGNGVGFK